MTSASSGKEPRSRWANYKAAFGLVGAVLQGGRGEAADSPDVERERRGPIAPGFGITDVYRPVRDCSERAAILLVHGLTADGPDDPRIPTFATTCARGGMAVVVPEFVSMKQRRMKVEDVEEVARAAGAVPGTVGVSRTVLLAFSYAAGPAYLAAARLGEEVVAGIVTVGAYHDIFHLLEFTATRQVRDYGGDQPSAPPNEAKRVEGQWIFLASAGRWLPAEPDREVIAAAAERWEAGDAPAWSEVRQELGEGGRALLDAVTVADPEVQRQAMARMPEPIHEAMRELTLVDRLDDLRAPVVLIHGRNDQRIPHRESLLLAEALEDRTRVRLAILDAFVHAQREVGWSRFWRVAGDAVKLGRCGLEIIRWSV